MIQRQLASEGKAHGVDGSIICDGDLVYVLTSPAEITIRIIHYIRPVEPMPLRPELIQPSPSVELMYGNASDHKPLSHEMFAMTRHSKILRAIRRVQRRWRIWTDYKDDKHLQRRHARLVRFFERRWVLPHDVIRTIETCVPRPNPSTQR